MTYQRYLKLKQQEALVLDKEETAIRLLILELSGKNGAQFLADLNQEIPEDLLKKFDEATSEYLVHGRPIQHIIGYSYFYGYKMIVNPDVLIPRPETEELVGYVLNKYDELFPGQKVDVCDIGTGSGAIAIALAKEEANMELWASDISKEAIEVAKQNAKNNEARVHFLIGDMVEPFIEEHLQFDILVSNPPYIPQDEFVEAIVKDNEPHIALFGGVEGLDFYEKILSKAHLILKPTNLIAFEHSYSKREAIYKLVKKYFPDSIIEQIQDLNGKDRMTLVINRK